MSKDSIEIIVIEKEEEGERIDKILASRYKNHFSRTYFQYLLEQGLVLHNGCPLKKRGKPCAGDEIEIEFSAFPEIDLKPENIPLEILYEDEEIIAINKPAGMVVHPAPGNWQGTFVNALLFYCGSKLTSDNSLRPGIVHRLDKDTTGVLIAAKTLPMQQKLITLFAERKIYKEYLGICLGNVITKTIEASIGRDPIHRQKMQILEKGRKATTLCENLCFNGKLSVVKFILITGRTHQIRVHMKYNQTPILGDDLYGNGSINKKYEIKHQMLHSKRMRFIHPSSQKEIEIIAPIPPEMYHLISMIKDRSSSSSSN